MHSNARKFNSDQMILGCSVKLPQLMLPSMKELPRKILLTPVRIPRNLNQINHLHYNIMQVTS